MMVISIIFQTLAMLLVFVVASVVIRTIVTKTRHIDEEEK